MKKHIQILFIFSIFGFISKAQVLSLEDAISMALSKNNSIKVAQLQSQAIKKDAHIGNAGLLPKLDANAGGTYSNTVSNITFAGGIPPLDNINAINQSNNAGLQLSYTLFDGMGTFRTYQKLKTAGELSDVQSKISIESTILQVVSNYFDVLRNQQTLDFYKEALTISRDRLKRVEAGFQYGAGAKIEVLNAQVDYNNDSSNFISQQQNLFLSKNQMNYLLGRPINTLFEVVNNYPIVPLANMDSLKVKALNNNSSILLSEVNIDAAEIDKKLALSQFSPKVLLNSSYGYNFSESNASVLLKSSGIGFTGGLSLTWNLFDGLKHSKSLEKAKINIESSELKKEQATLNVEMEFLNIYQAFTTNLQLIALEKENVEVARLNMERSKDLFYLGSITNLQFRQAQINLLVSQNKLNNLNFQAKVQEFQIKRLVNELIN